MYELIYGRGEGETYKVENVGRVLSGIYLVVSDPMDVDKTVVEVFTANNLREALEYFISKGYYGREYYLVVGSTGEVFKIARTETK